MEKSIKAAHNSRWRAADVVFGLMLTAGFVLNLVYPMSLEGLMPPYLFHLIGAPLLALGSFIILSSKRDLQQFEQSSEPGRATTQLVTSGLYQYSRNPSYLGIMICFFGLAIAMDMPWFLVLALPTLVFTQVYLIGPEEIYLERKFGKEYSNYKKRVRSWL